MDELALQAPEALLVELLLQARQHLVGLGLGDLDPPIRAGEAHYGGRCGVADMPMAVRALELRRVLDSLDVLTYAVLSPLREISP
jgi:hypothetical protein